jgi:nitrate reductase beta subunit
VVQQRRNQTGHWLSKNWEDQDEWQGGWIRGIHGKLTPRLGGKMGVLSKIFANPVLPQIDDYYEPFTFDYQDLHRAPEGIISLPPALAR